MGQQGLMMRSKKLFLRIGVPLLVLLIVAVFLLIRNANVIIQHELEAFLGKGFSVERIGLHWGSVRAEGITLDRPDGKRAFSTERLSVTANFLNLIRRKNIISRVSLENPVILYEVDPGGRMVPFIPDKKSEKQAKNKSSESSQSFLIKSFAVDGGSLDYLDRSVRGGPVKIPFRNIDLRVDDLVVPPSDSVSSYRLGAAVSGKGSSGTVNASGTLNPKTKDTKTKLMIKNLDVTLLKPYYQKKGDVDVTRGFVSVDADIVIKNSRIASSGKIILRELAFSDKGGTFLGLPLSAVMAMMKNSRGEIDLDFSIEGDLNNPKFNIANSIVEKLALSLAKTLGLPLESIGKSVFDFGGSALKQLFGQ